MDDLSLAKALVDRLTAKDAATLLQYLQDRVGQKADDHAGLRTDNKTEFNPAQFGLAICFAETAAANFHRSLSAAKEAQHFLEYFEGKKKWFMAAWRDEDFAAASPLCDALSGLRNRRVYVSGKESDWSDVFSYSYCAKARTRAYRPHQYCFGGEQGNWNPWGCVQAQMEWREWSRWLTYGHFEKGGGIFSSNKYIWIFDKERIRHDLESSTFKVRFCPHLRLDILQAALEALPNRVEVVSGGDWAFQRSFQEVAGAPYIVEESSSGGILMKDEFYAVGVRPVGSRALRTVLEKVRRRTGSREVPDVPLIADN